MSELSDRKQKILAAVVEQYIATGEPVGSKALLSLLPFSVSSATVRNEMAELSEMGYLEQPHTSAGRVPSQKGYRYYVDKLMNNYELSDREKRTIEMKLGTQVRSPEQVLETASELLADMTNCAAVSTTPSDAAAVIRRVELVPVGTRLAMIVMLTSSGILKSTIVRTDSELTLDVVESFYNIVNKLFVGNPVSEMNMALLQTLAVSLGDKALIMTPLLVALSDLASTAGKSDMLLEGQSNLLHHREIASNAYELMEFLRRGEPLTNLFSAHRDELNVLIGKENLYRELENSSLIFSRYNIGGRDSGTLGIVGPTNIDYARLIPGLKYLTTIVGKLLTDAVEE